MSDLPKRDRTGEKKYLSASRKAEQHERMLAEVERERLYEIEMSERIASESAAIRAEWSEDETERRRVSRRPDVMVPRCSGGSGRWNGIDCG